MEFGKYRRNLFKQYYYNIDKHLEEIDGFNDIMSDYWDACNGQFKINLDNKPNIRKWNQEKNEYEFYCNNSKHWTLCDPTVDNPKSIQYASMNRTYMLFKNKYTNQYEIPTISLFNGDSFDLTKFKLYICLTREEFKVYWANPYPSFHITREFHEYEKNDPKNKGLAGVRTFYFDAFHFRGGPSVTPNRKHPYVDFIFSPKNEMNKHLTKNYWDAIIPCLQEK
jgi:hypothetical protein